MEVSWSAIAIDTGGTFTDVIAIRPEDLKVFKLPSTPDNPANAVKDAIAQLGGGSEIMHGTTVATNAILERKGAKVVLITTSGFGDVIEIGRQNREDIYALYPSRTEPLVEAADRFEISERVTASGEVLKPIDTAELQEIIQNIREASPESIAVSLLFSFLHPDHEQLIKQAAEQIAPTSISSQVHPEYREFERTSTTVVDAYIKPIIGSYLENLTQYVSSNQLSNKLAVMKSDRGLAMVNSIISRPVDTIFSGLAGGVQAVEFASAMTGMTNLLSIDIGGTSTDVAAIIDGEAKLQQSQTIDNLPVSRPAVDVVTIGAGGGSLIQYQSGLLRVGPESAGADPGPIAYNMGGTIPTVTDLDLAYGILPTELAGGVLSLDREKSLDSLRSFAAKIEMELPQFISGTRRIFHENIAGAVRSVSTQRGYDPRTFALIAFGGAGPVHACEIAEVMNMSKVLIPPFPGVWSSMGLLGADYQYSSSIGRIKQLTELNDGVIKAELDQLRAEVRARAKADNLDMETGKFQPVLSLRFVGQSYELDVPYTGIERTRTDFIDLHRERYGFAAESEPVELVSIKLTLIIPHPTPVLPEFQSEATDRVKAYHQVGELDRVPVYDKSALSTTTQWAGPMIIEQEDTTIWIPPGWIAKIDTFGFILIERRDH